jgi:hypothetical protein
MPAETNTLHNGKPGEKTLQEHPRSCKALGATPASALARPHGTAQRPGGKNVPLPSASLCGILWISPQRLGGCSQGKPQGSSK